MVWWWLRLASLLPVLVVEKGAPPDLSVARQPEEEVVEASPLSVILQEVEEEVATAPPLHQKTYEHVDQRECAQRQHDQF